MIDARLRVLGRPKGPNSWRRLPSRSVRGGSDDANDSDNDHCKTDCTFNECGDGILNELAEACDDGNWFNGDGCSAQCEIEGPGACGDGVVQEANGEQCDDANLDDTDLCTSICNLAACGDGFLQLPAGEQCDDGNAMGGDGCSAQCTSE